MTVRKADRGSLFINGKLVGTFDSVSMSFASSQHKHMFTVRYDVDLKWKPRFCRLRRPVQNCFCNLQEAEFRPL